MRCHPERRLARSLRQTESKDLRLHFGNYAMNFWDTTLAMSVLKGRTGFSWNLLLTGEAALACLRLRSW